MLPQPNDNNRFRYFAELDGLRGIAILLVLAGHELERYGVYSLTPLATTGVQIFFVLSGFLVGGVLVREHRKSGRISLKNFYLRRVFRIFPAFYLLIAVTAALVYFGAVKDISWRTVAISAAYLRNVGGSGPALGHTWSLAVEEHFYMFFPLLLVLLPRRFWLRAGIVGVASEPSRLCMHSFPTVSASSICAPTFASTRF